MKTLSVDRNDMEETFDKIKKIISEILDIDAATVSLESKLDDDLNISSFDALDVLNAIEDEMDLKIKEVDYESFVTVRDLVEYVDDHL